MDSKEIAQLIERTGLKKQDVAAAIGVSVATLRRYEHGESAMPDDKVSELKKIAGGGRQLHSLGSRKPAAAAVLAEVPATVLIEELARRARGGQLRESGAGELDARRSLRAVAFTDVADD